jgi:hypothetical protein
MKRKALIPLIALIILIGCRRDPQPEEETADPDVPPKPALAVLDDSEIQSEQKILLAFARAYPGKIDNVEFLDGDWVMRVNGKLIYFANNRFLPEELREEWVDYRPFAYYAYPWKGTARERRSAYENQGEPSIGSCFLFDALYFSAAEDESWECQVKYSFLGVKMLIHYSIEPILDVIEDHILASARIDPSINEWIEELQTSPPTGGWNWRDVRGSGNRSNHAYGIAIDLTPREYRGRVTFWQWQWLAVETLDSKRFYLPPEPVIKIFEDYGFLWGGNWDLYDTMHFEYRPEILLLNGFSVNMVQ